MGNVSMDDFSYEVKQSNLNSCQAPPIVPETPPSADSATVREFITAVAQQTQRVSGDLDGFLQLTRINPRDESLAWTRWEPNDIEGMVAQAIADADAGHNVYCEPRLIRRDTPPRERGTAEYTVAVFAVVVDSDGWKDGAACEASLDPSSVVETSPGSHHRWYFLDKATTDSEAKEIGAAVRAAGGDSATGRTGLYRVAGTVNRPDKKKTAQRGPGVYPVRLTEPFCGVVYSAAALRAAFPPKRNGGLGFDFNFNNARRQRSSLAPLALPDALKTLVRDGVPEGERSVKFHSAVGWLKRLHWTADDIVTLLEAHPAGIAAKYVGRLREEVERSFGKVDGPAAEKSAPDSHPCGLEIIRADTVVQTATEPFPFVLARDITLEPKAFLIDGLVGAGETSAWYGPPDGGKSTVALDAGCRIAAGIDYCGRRVTQGIVLYVAIERGAVVKRRVLAWCKHHKLPDIPLAVVAEIVDLRTGQVDADRIIATAKALSVVCEQAVVWIIIDTLNRALAGGDENSSKDMGAAITAVDRIQRNTGAHCSLIHHVPVDRTDRMRGHGSVLGAVDLTVRITKDDKIVTVEADKANDLVEKPCLTFRFESVELARDGLAITSAPVWSPVKRRPERRERQR